MSVYRRSTVKSTEACEVLETDLSGLNMRYNEQCIGQWTAGGTQRPMPPQIQTPKPGGVRQLYYTLCHSVASANIIRIKIRRLFVISEETAHATTTQAHRDKNNIKNNIKSIMLWSVRDMDINTVPK